MLLLLSLGGLNYGFTCVYDTPAVTVVAAVPYVPSVTGVAAIAPAHGIAAVAAGFCTPAIDAIAAVPASPLAQYDLPSHFNPRLII